MNDISDPKRAVKEEDLRKLQRDDGFDFTIAIFIRVKCDIISENRINFN